MSTAEGLVAPSGELSLRVIRGSKNEPAVGPVVSNWRDVVAHGFPRPGQPEALQRWKLRNAPNLWRGARRFAMARALRLPHFYGELWLKVIYADGGECDLGLVSMRVVTDVGVGYIVDAFQNLVELENMKYHALGTGSTGEAAGDTALVTELTTEYTGNVRATGTTTETSANIYSTVATNTLDGSPSGALREHGIFSANAAGVLLDRTVFSAITLVSGDGLQSTYNLTMASGS